MCRGGWSGTRVGDGGGSTVTALAFDALSPGVLYVGSEAGDVMVRIYIWLQLDIQSELTSRKRRYQHAGVLGAFRS